MRQFFQVSGARAAHRSRGANEGGLLTYPSSGTHSGYTPDYEPERGRELVLLENRARLKAGRNT
jgi:hypothetical protein